MIKINDDTLKIAFQKLYNHYYYSNIIHMKSLINDALSKIKEEGNLYFFNMFLEYINLSDENCIDENIGVIKVPKKNSFVEEKNHLNCSYNYFINCDLYFYLVDVLFAMSLIENGFILENENIFGNIVDKHANMNLNNKCLFKPYMPNYMKWKNSLISGDPIKEEQTILKLDFTEAYYSISIEIEQFENMFKDNVDKDIFDTILKMFKKYSSVCAKIKKHYACQSVYYHLILYLIIY